jgi:hypothetical protein
VVESAEGEGAADRKKGKRSRLGERERERRGYTRQMVCWEEQVGDDSAGL